MRALQVVSGNEMYADKQQMLASPTSWETHAPLRALHDRIRDTARFL